jgi:hypothetical protein
MADKDFRVKLGLHVGANAYIEGNITSVDQIQMNIASPAAVGGAGQLAWNIDENTLDLGMNANTTMQVGQEAYYYVKNQTGNTIPDGTVVMANGTVGLSGRIKVAPAIADGTFPSKYIIGITTEEIVDGADGFVTSFGKIRQIDTSMFNEGDILYANPAVPGGLSNTIPIAPNNIVTMAIVVTANDSNGEIFVRPTYGSMLYENENIYLDSVSDGQALVYVSANSRFENKTVAAAQSNSFTTISVSGQSSIQANSSNDTLTFVAGSGINITTDTANDAITITNTGGGGSASNSFSTISVSGQNNVVASSSADTLTLVAGSGISITTNSESDSISIAATGGGGAASVVISDTAPESPTAGTLWFDSTSATMMIYYTDVDSSQWIEIIGSQGPTGPDGSISKALAMTYVFN